jgi:MYXO-CTERM domain-containing protein
MLREQLTNAITTDDSSVIDACTVDLHVVSHDAKLDVSSPPPFCLKLETFCFLSGGKEDGESEAPPPWADDPTDDPTDDTANDSAGCSVGADDSTGWMLLAFVGIGLVARRRSRLA